MSRVKAKRERSCEVSRWRAPNVTVQAAVIAVGLLCITPRAAHACLWNVFEWFQPLPNCAVADGPTRYRTDQVNHRILAKLTVLVQEIRQLQAEVVGWQSAFASARSFRNRLTAVYADFSADPIPSLAAMYERTPIASFVTLRANGTYGLALQPLSFRRIADSVWLSYQDSLQLPTAYRRNWARRNPLMLPVPVFGAGRVLDGQIVALGDFERFTKPIEDSLSTVGSRTAMRYEGRADIDGLAEVRVSALAAELLRVRALAFDALSGGLSARIQAATEATDKRRALDRLLTADAAAEGY